MLEIKTAIAKRQSAILFLVKKNYNSYFHNRNYVLLGNTSSYTFVNKIVKQIFSLLPCHICWTLLLDKLNKWSCKKCVLKVYFSKVFRTKSGHSWRNTHRQRAFKFHRKHRYRTRCMLTAEPQAYRDPRAVWTAMPLFLLQMMNLPEPLNQQAFRCTKQQHKVKRKSK